MNDNIRIASKQTVFGEERQKRMSGVFDIILNFSLDKAEPGSETIKPTDTSKKATTNSDSN